MPRSLAAIMLAPLLSVACDRPGLHTPLIESASTRNIRFDYNGQHYEGASMQITYNAPRSRGAYERVVTSGVLFVEAGAPAAAITADFHGNTKLELAGHEEVSIRGRAVVLVLAGGLVLVPEWRVPEDLNDEERIEEWVVARFEETQDEALASAVRRCGR